MLTLRERRGIVTTLVSMLVASDTSMNLRFEMLVFVLVGLSGLFLDGLSHAGNGLFKARRSTANGGLIIVVFGSPSKGKIEAVVTIVIFVVVNVGETVVSPRLCSRERTNTRNVL